MKTLTTLSLIGALALSTTAFADDSTSGPAPSIPSAAQQCRTERSAMGRELFRLAYGTNRNKRNAFGKCVSQKAKFKTSKAVHDAVEADVNAAKACKAERKTDPSAFAEKYGSGTSKRNAFGKCVSKRAKALQDDQS